MSSLLLSLLKELCIKHRGKPNKRSKSEKYVLPSSICGTAVSEQVVILDCELSRVYLVEGKAGFKTVLSCMT